MIHISRGRTLRRSMAVLWLIAVALVGSSQSFAAETPANLETFRTQVALPSVVLVDQFGNSHQLESLFKEHVVVVDFVFTSCRSVCPIITAVMKRVHQVLKNSLGDSLLLVSITLAPQQDSPEQLAQFANKLGNFPHWLWLSGEPPAVGQAIQAFGINPNAAPETHPPLIVVGQGKDWFKWVGLPDAQTIAQAALTMLQKQKNPAP
ncbi:MAG: hypothetical protein CTY19_15660 [Methylomonas sp.]|nr:MAG: hypothetical protein CTY19_15660 [Methylomonas sp.]